jgi:photosystem II stability/assembly factor-like uncharacterized protein
VYTFAVSVNNLALDPTNPSNLYAGGSGHLFHSTDDGLSWAQVYNLGEIVSVISSTLVLAGGQVAPPDQSCFSGVQSIAYSQDSGLTWTTTFTGCVSALTLIKYHPNQPEVIYVGGSDRENKFPLLLRSADGGYSWVSLLSQREIAGGPMQSLVIDFQNPMRLYAADLYGVFYSTDQGQTWSEINQLPQASILLAQNGESLYAVPSDPYQDLRVYRSDNGGVSWWATLDRLPSYPHVLIANPLRAGVLYAGLHGYGVFRSPDQSNSWQERNTGIRSLAPINALAVAPTDPDLIYAGSEQPRGGLFRSNDRGQTWTTVITDTSILSVAINPVTPTLAYAGSPHGIYQTEDGVRWYLDALAYPTFAITANGDPKGTFAAGSTEMQPSPTSRGFVAQYSPPVPGVVGSWAPHYISDVLSIASVAVHPRDPLTVYAAGTSKDKTGVIYRSRDGGQTWQRVFEDPLPYICGITIDPDNPNKLYASEFDRVFRSLDGGDKWELMKPFSPNLPYGRPSTALAVDDLSVFWVGFTQGIYRWEPGQETWALDGLPDLWTETLVFQPATPRRLLAGNEFGLWVRLLPAVSKTWLPLIRK